MLNKIVNKLLLFLLLIVVSCNENNTDVTNNNNSETPNVNSESNDSGENSEESTSGNASTSESSTSKTDAEIILEGGKILLNSTIDIIEKQRIKDSINLANKEKMFAYQIGLKYKEKDAFEAYKKLIKAGVSNVYVFKAARKEYYIVKFEAKEKQELESAKNDVKSKLGDLAAEGLDVINLMDFCSKKETVIRFKDKSNRIEIKCLACD